MGTAAPANAATPKAWTCSSQAYLFQDPTGGPTTSIFQVDLASGASSQIGSTTDLINGVGYNTLDNFIYGWDEFTASIVKVGSNGASTSLGLPAGIPSTATIRTGDFDLAGHYWGLDVVNGNWYEVDYAPGSATYGQVLASGTLSVPTGASEIPLDWSFINGKLYAVVSSTTGPGTQLLVFDPATGTMSIAGALPNVPAGRYGAAYTDLAGDLFVSNNDTGEIYRINISNFTSIDVNTGPVSGLNDGARCALAPVATMTLTKSVNGRVDPSDQFTVALSEPAGTDTSVTTSGTQTTASTTNWPVSPGMTYSITDTMAAGSADPLGSYSAVISCTDDTTGASVNATGPPGSWSFTPTATHDYSCTITNTAAGATVVKHAAVTDANNDGITDAGDTVQYSFTVTNTGQDTLNNVTVNDAGFSGTGSFPTVSCPSSTLAAGQSMTCTATGTYTVTAADASSGVLNNQATVTGTKTDGTSITSTPSSTSTPLTVAAPALSLTKTATPTTVSKVGDTVAYSFLVTNTGNTTVSNVAVNETAFTGTGTLPPITCPATTLAPGASTTCTATYTATTQADLDAGKISNTAVATGTGAPNGTPITSPPSTATVSATQTPALTLVKSASPNDPAHFTVGQVITYSFAVTNTGNVTMSNVSVADTGFTGSGALSPVTCPTTTLAPAESTTCTATYTITQADVDAGKISNDATAQGTPPGSTTPTTSPNSHVDVPAAQNPALSLVKSATPTQVTNAGDTVTYSFLITNTGNVTIANAGVNETSFTGTGAAPAVSCPAGAVSLAPGTSVTCTATYTATQADVDAGSITNTATGTGTDTNGSPVVSPPSTATVTVTAAPALTVVKSATPSTITAAGDTVTYSFLVTNTGNVTMSNVAVNETAFTGTGTAPVASCPVTTLAPGESTTCTATYTATQADVDAGSITNTATAQGTPPGSTTPVISEPSTATVAVPPAPILTVVKTATPATITAAGDTVTYSFLVTNTGNVTMSNIVINETAFTGTGTAPVVSCPAGAASLAPGASVTCTASYTATQADVDAGSITNTATTQGTPPGSTTPVTSPPSTATVTATPAAALTVVKTAAPATVGKAGDTVSYSFVVTNTGNVTMSNVSVNETVFSGTGSAPVVSCPVTTLAPGESTTCTASYTATQADVDAGSITNTATAQGTPPTPAGSTTPPAPVVSPPSTATVTAAPVAALAIVKSASPNDAVHFTVGQVITYSFDVTNTGNVTMSNVSVTDTGFTGSGTLSPISCPAGAALLAPGASVTCTATYTIAQADVDAGKISNDATAQGTPPAPAGSTTPPAPVTSPKSHVDVPGTQTPALTVVKSATPSTITAAGDTVTYSFLVTNTGNVTMSNVAVNETSFSGTGTAPVVSCPVTTLAPGASTTCTASYTATQADVDAGSVTNTATAQGTPPGSTTPTVSPGSTATVAATPVPALSVVKSASPSDPASFKVGQVVTYSFAVTNTGNVTMSNVMVADTGFTGSGMLSPVSCPAGAASLAPGASVTCTATYTITQADVDAGKISNDATAQGTAPGAMTPTTSPKSHVDIPAAQKPALSVVKSATPASTGKAGDKVTYSFLVTNTGNVTMTDVKVDEGAFTGTGTAPVVSCPAGVASLAPGASVTCTASYVLTQADVDAGSVTNTATAQGTPPTPAGSTTPPAPVKSPPSTATVSSDPAPGLSVVKTASKGTVSAGDKITYSFLVTNTGNVTMTGVTVNEGSFNGKGTLSKVSCPSDAASLAPGAKVTCTATYTVDPSDVGAGTLVNTASATGKTPTGVAVHSAGSSAKVMVVDSTKILAYTGAGGGILVSFLGAITLLGGLAIMVIARRRRHQQ